MGVEAAGTGLSEHPAARPYPTSASSVVAMGQVFGIEMVGQSTVAIMQTCGKFDRVLDPGCHWVPCCLGSFIAGKQPRYLHNRESSWMVCTPSTASSSSQVRLCSIGLGHMSLGTAVRFPSLDGDGVR